MKLYPKRLNSLEELKREKHMLKYARQHTRKDGLPEIKLPFTTHTSKPSDMISMAGDLLTSKSFADMALTIGLPMLKLVGRKTEKSLLKTVAGELIGGYVKWKILQLGMRGVKLLLKKEQSKKEEERLRKQEQKKKHRAAH